MKKIKLALFLLFSVMLCLAGPVIAGETEAPTEAPTPAISETKLLLYKGQKKYLKVTGTEATVKWTSSKPNVVKVGRRGRLTALARGRAVITATVGSTKLTCNVRVRLPKLVLNKKNLKVEAGNVKHLKVKELKGWKEDIVWKTSNKKIAVVSSNGTVTGKNAGICVVSATANGVTAKVNVTVTAPPSIQLDQTSMYLLPGEWDVLEATLVGSTSKTSWSWSTSNKSVATVEPSGNTCIVRAVGPGSAKITVKTGTLKEVCEVSVIQSSSVSYADVETKTASGVKTESAVGRHSDGSVAWRVPLATGTATETYRLTVVNFQNYVFGVTTNKVYVMNLQNGQILNKIDLSIGASPIACVDKNGYLYVTSSYIGATPHTVYRLLFSDNSKLSLMWSSKLNSLFLEPYGMHVDGSYLFIYDDGYYYSSARISTIYGTVVYTK